MRAPHAESVVGIIIGQRTLIAVEVWSRQTAVNLQHPFIGAQ